jgi:hypothetical protein
MQPIMASIARARANRRRPLSLSHKSGTSALHLAQEVICRALVGDTLPIISSTDIGRLFVLRAPLVQHPNTCHKTTKKTCPVCGCKGKPTSLISPGGEAPLRAFPFGSSAYASSDPQRKNDVAIERKTPSPDSGHRTTLRRTFFSPKAPVTFQGIADSSKVIVSFFSLSPMALV